MEWELTVDHCAALQNHHYELKPYRVSIKEPNTTKVRTIQKENWLPDVFSCCSDVRHGVSFFLLLNFVCLSYKCFNHHLLLQDLPFIFIVNLLFFQDKYLLSFCKMLTSKTISELMAEWFQDFYRLNHRKRQSHWTLK